MRTGARALLAMLASVAVASCSPGDDDAGGADASAGTTSSPATSPVTSPMTSTSVTQSTATDPTTSNPPAVEPLEVTTEQLVSEVADSGIDGLRGLTVVDGAEQRALFATVNRTAPGEPARAAVHSLAEGTLEVLELDDGGADESAAYGIWSDGATVRALGAVVDGPGRSIATIWTSNDGGSTFGGYEAIPNVDSVHLAVSAGGANPLVIGGRTVDGEREAVVLRNDVGSWEASRLPAQVSAGAVGATSADGIVVIAGWTAPDATSQAAVWWSADGGSTFQPTDDEELGRFAAIGPPALGGDGFVALAAGSGQEPAAIVTSADGRTWRSIELEVVDRTGAPASTIGRPVDSIVPYEGGYAAGFGGQDAATALVDATGGGQLLDVPDAPGELFSDAHPFVLDGDLHVAGNNALSYRVMRLDRTEQAFVPAAAPRPGAGGAASLVRLITTSDGVLARADAYPVVRDLGDNVLSMGGSRTWNRHEDGVWRFTDEIPDQAGWVAVNGRQELLIQTSEDPADSDPRGPSGGTSSAVRAAGGPWSDLELFMSGPGGEYAEDLVALLDGFLAVGIGYRTDEAGVTTRSPLISEYVDGTWTDRPLPGAGPQAMLLHAAALDDGTALALGSYEDGAVTMPLGYLRDPAGTWGRVVLPDEERGWTVVQAIAGADGFTVIGVADGEYVAHRSTDGRSFTTAAIEFPEVGARPARFVPSPTGALAVGIVVEEGVSELAVWTLGGNEVARVPLADAPFARSISVTAAESVGPDLLIGGIIHGQDVVWRVPDPSASSTGD